MSNNIPFEIQVEIMKRLPVKSLIQFRSVSKTWKAMIQSSDFVTHYNSQNQHIFVKYIDAVDDGIKYVSLVDDDIFHAHKVSLQPPYPISEYYYNLVGYSHDLLCFHGAYQPGSDGPLTGTSRAIIWNPSIRKAVDVVVPNVAYDNTTLGFGVCRETNDPKIVKITYDDSSNVIISSIRFHVEVFTLSTGAWRNLHNNLPRKSVQFINGSFHTCSIAIDGVIYWFVADRISMNGKPCYLIISFDVTSENFGEVNLPDRLALGGYNKYRSMSKLRESLVVIETVIEGNSVVYDVWMMEGGATKSFTKLYIFDIITIYRTSIRGFRKTGEPILEIQEGSHGKLAVYEPHSKQTYNLGIEGTFFVLPYKETLFLLDHNDAGQDNLVS